MTARVQRTAIYLMLFFAWILSSCCLPKANYKELIQPWLGQKAITLKTSFTVNGLRVWHVAIPRFTGRKGWHSNEFYFPPGVEFSIKGIKVNRSSFNGDYISIMVHSPLVSNQDVHLDAWLWGSKDWRSLTFEEQLMPQNFHLFFEGNPNFSLR